MLEQPSVDPSCPLPSATVFTTTYSGVIVAPNTTIPYTTTAVLTNVGPPLVTSTEVVTFTFSGSVPEPASATGPPAFSGFTTTLTETFTHTGFPFPSGCA
ncbi:hypothetical protein AcV7_005995 [Taiwanofungus camphoratus]|nr:hypothetical protein AcV7_005995 [Antrodia cinnamomea]